MKSPQARFCMGLSLFGLAGFALAALPAAQVVPPVTPPPIQAPAPWVPPAYPEHVSMKQIKDGDKIGGELTDSMGISNAVKGVKIENSISVPDGQIIDIGANSKVYCLPQVGKPETPFSLDGWLLTHGSATAPAYLGAYEGRIKMAVFHGAIRASYTVFKGIDIDSRGALLDFKNCLFIDCTIKADGSAGGQLDMVNCTLQNGTAKTALAIVRSVRGPITHLKGVKFDGFTTAITIDAYDSALPRTCAWDVKELSFSNISGKAISDADPIKVEIGRVFLMGEKDAKAAAEKYIETRTPGNNQTGTPAVNIPNISPTELPQIGAGITDPTSKETNPKDPAGHGTNLHDDG